MTHSPREFLRLIPASPASPQPVTARLPPDAEALLGMAGALGPRDLAALSHIIRRTAEICEKDGEETALAVLDQIHAILRNRVADA